MLTVGEREIMQKLAVAAAAASVWERFMRVEISRVHSSFLLLFNQKWDPVNYPSGRARCDDKVLFSCVVADDAVLMTSAIANFAPQCSSFQW